MRIRTLLTLSLWILANPDPSGAQNIPPFIGGGLTKPKVNFPNPLEQRNTQRSRESGQQSAVIPQDSEIRRLLDQISLGYSSKNLDTVAACYLQNEELKVYWESQEFRGWGSFKGSLEQIFNSTLTVKLELTAVETHIFGRFAWVTAHYSREQLKDGVSSGQQGRLTLILQKSKANWNILHEHASPLL